MAQDTRVNYNFPLRSSLCSSQRVNRSIFITNFPWNSCFPDSVDKTESHNSIWSYICLCHLCVPEVRIILLSTVLSMVGPVDVAQETSPWIMLLGRAVVILSCMKYLFPTGWRQKEWLLIYSDNVSKREPTEKRQLKSKLICMLILSLIDLFLYW